MWQTVGKFSWRFGVFVHFIRSSGTCDIYYKNIKELSLKPHTPSCYYWKNLIWVVTWNGGATGRRPSTIMGLLCWIQSISSAPAEGIPRSWPHKAGNTNSWLIRVTDFQNLFNYPLLRFARCVLLENTGLDFFYLAICERKVSRHLSAVKSNFFNNTDYRIP